MVTLADVGTTNLLGNEYAGLGAGPHVIVYDMGMDIDINGIYYAQRSIFGINDKVFKIEVWISSSDPGSAATNLPILGLTPNKVLLMKQTSLRVLEFFVLLLVWRVLMYIIGMIINFFNWQDSINPLVLMIGGAVLSLAIVILLSKIIHIYYDF